MSRQHKHSPLSSASIKRKGRTRPPSAVPPQISVPRPTDKDHDSWHAFWIVQRQPWRMEPEIDPKRQHELAQRRTTVPGIDNRIYPFKGMRLSRADIEWLLATHENGRGPVDWNDESQREREGLDLRGAILREVDLSELPLACLQGGLTIGEWIEANKEQNGVVTIHLEHTVLCGAHLEHANLVEAQLQGAQLTNAWMQGANLFQAHLEHAILTDAHLEGVDCSDAYLESANLSNAQLQSAILTRADLKKADLRKANLTGADLQMALLNEADLREAQLKDADLQDARLRRANLFMAQLEDASLISASLEGADLFRANLKGADLDGINLKGADLREAQLKRAALNGIYLESSDLRGANLEQAVLQATLTPAKLGDAKRIGPRMADVQWGNTNLTVIQWHQVNILGDEYEARQKRWADGKVKDKFTRLYEYEEAVRANRQLAMVLQNQGLSEIAARFAYRAQVLQRKVFWFQITQNKSSMRLRQFTFRQRIGYQTKALGAWLFSWFLFLLTGYGYKPGCSFLAYLLVIGTFMALYLLLDPHLVWYEALVVSMTAFHGRGFSPSTFSPSDPLSIASAVEAFVGLIIEVTFIATLTRRFFGQ